MREDNPTWQRFAAANPSLAMLHVLEVDGGPELSRQAEIDMDTWLAGTAAERQVAALPPITNRRSIAKFISAIPAALTAKKITAADAKALLYTAQLALAALPQRNQTSRSARRKIGFDK